VEYRPNANAAVLWNTGPTKGDQAWKE
jgi:hypothetical protein